MHIWRIIPHTYCNKTAKVIKVTIMFVLLEERSPSISNCFQQCKHHDKGAVYFYEVCSLEIELMLRSFFQLTKLNFNVGYVIKWRVT